MGRDQAPKILFLEGTAVKLVERGPERVSSSTETRTTVPKVRHLPVSTHKLHTHSVGTRGHSDVEVRRGRSRHIVIATPNQISCGHSTDKRRIVYSERGQTIGLVQQHTTREVASALRVSGTARKFRPDIPKITSASLACRATITRPSLSSAPQTDSPPPRILLLFTSSLFCFSFPRLPFSPGRLFRCMRRHAHGCLSVRASHAAYIRG